MRGQLQLAKGEIDAQIALFFANKITVFAIDYRRYIGNGIAVEIV